MSGRNFGLSVAQIKQIKWALSKPERIYPVKLICIVCKKSEQWKNKRCKSCQ